MVVFTINSREVSFGGDDGTPLLWVIRDTLGLTGTKYACGVGECGACTVHINGRARKACMMPVSAVGGRRVTTIEGLAPSDDELHPVQEAWIEHDVPQCGYCQAGQIMAAADLLRRNPQPSDEDIDAEIDVLCRCGTYPRIRKAIHRAAQLAGEKS
jgi:aerobic-type carbon monoxide dehydrogenase small subunit (CoxS/CutS family)